MANSVRRFAVVLSLAAVACMPSHAGSLSGTSSSGASNYNISSYGTLDWSAWGNGTAPGRVMRASGGGTFIPGYTVVGATTAVSVTNARRSIQWSGGTPIATSSSNYKLVQVSGIGNGFRFVLPADAQSRTVRFNFDLKSAGAQFRATLSDSSAPDYVATASNTTSGNPQYTLTYSADGPGRTLTVTFIQTAGSGGVRLAAVEAPTFTYVNHAPKVAVPGSITVTQGQPIGVQVDASDPDGDTLIYSATGLPPGVSINSSSGLVSGTPTTLGTYSANVFVKDRSDASALSDSGSIVFKVSTAPNTPPSGASGSFSTAFETPVNVNPVWSDPDSGDSWTIAIQGQPAHGTATASGGVITYTPSTGYVGSDSFTFRVTDSHGAFTIGTVSGNVTSVTPGQVTAVSATQGTLLGAVNLSWPSAPSSTSYDVLRGTSPSDSSPTLLANVSVLNFSDTSAEDGVQYWYSVRARNGSASGEVSPSVIGFADTPPASATATFAATLETPVEVLPTFVDPDAGDTVSLAVVTQPANGVAVVAGSHFVYTPNSGFVGSDSFTFSVTDRAGASATGTASGSITALPPARVSSLTATQGTRVGSVELSWSPAANARSYRVLRGVSPSDPSPAELGIAVSTSFSDNTAVAGTQYFYSLESLTVGQKSLASSPTLGYADTPPSSASASFAAVLETPLLVSPSFVDPDTGDIATIGIVSQPSNGIASVSSNQITYTPNAGYVGNDSFAFSVTDRAGASVTGVASGTVTALPPSPVGLVTATQGALLNSVRLTWSPATNARSYRVLRAISPADPAPIALGVVSTADFTDNTASPGVHYFYSVQSLTIGQQATPSSAVLGYADTPPSGASAAFAATLETAIQVVPTFSDADVGDTASFSVASQPANGVVAIADNKIWYTPNPGFVGADSFSFLVTDRAGASTTGVASGSVTALPPATVPSVNATQGTLVGSVSLLWPPSANARSYRILRGVSQSDPAPVTLGTTSSTSWSDSTAAAGASYYYSVQALTIGQEATPSPSSLGFADTPPSLASASFSTATNTPVSISPVFTDPDVGDVPTLAVVSPPSRGTVSVSGTSFRYTPDTDFYGNDSFVFSVTDRAGATTTGTASGVVSITPSDPISGLRASQGGSLGSVNLSWDRSANTTNYRVFRGTSAADPAPMQIGSVAGTSFTDGGLSPGQGFFYSIQPYNLTLAGTVSPAVYGFADTPPSLASGSFSTIQEKSVTFVPTWTDPDVGDVHTLAIVRQPAHGSASVSNNQLVYVPQTGYIGSDDFGFSITDRAGASITATATGSVNPGVPSAPLGFVASQGTVVGGVSLRWDNTIGSVQYLVSRSQVRNSSAAEVIATVDTNEFLDATATPGATYYYRIRGVGVSGIGPNSEEVSGYGDTPPSSATADVATVYNTAVTFKPQVVDPDPLESHTLAVSAQPAGGMVSVSADRTRLTYTPNAGFSGIDTFSFVATDVAGATVNGLARIAVGCPSPTLGALGISQPKIFANSGFTISTVYGNTSCPTAISAKMEVMSGTTVVRSVDAGTLPGAVSAPLAFAVDGLQPGSYSLRVTVTDTNTLLSTVSSLPLAVPAYRMPTFTATAVAFADLDTATVAVGRSDDCTLTSNRSAAIADHNLCFYDVSGIPSGLAFDGAQALPVWTGRPNTPGSYSPTLTVFQYDDAGTPRQLGQTVRSTTVQGLSAMTFSSPTNIQAAQYIQLIGINVQQTAGPNCPITTDRSQALANTLRGLRSCYVQYTPMPPRSTLTATGLTAYFLVAGTVSVGWSVSTFDTAGTEIRFASGSSEVNVRPVDVDFEPQWGDRNPIATVTRASVRLVNRGSDKCVATVDPAAANVSNADKPCLIEWTSIPAGISQDAGTTSALLGGVFTTVGQVPVSFTVSYYDVEGNKQVLLNATKNVTVDPPPLPPFIMKTARPIGDDRYVVPDNGGLLGILVTEPGKWPIDAIVKWSDQSAATTHRVNPNSGTQLLAATPSPLWTSREVDVRLQLRDAPGLYTDKRVTVISVPPDGLRIGLDPLNPDIPDSEPVPVTARIDMPSKTGPFFDQALMGRWAVQFGLKDSASQFIPQGEPVPVDSNGIATSTLNPFGNTVIRAQAVAVPIVDLPGYTRKLESQLRMASVVKGTPIDATIGLYRGGNEGPAPFVAVLRVSFKTRSDQLANESVKWKHSYDDGATWEDIVEDGFQITQRLAEGRHRIKAIFVNRNTHVVSESNVLELRAWSVPKISFTGSTYAFPGSITNLNVVLTHPTGAAVTSGIVEWTVNKRVQLAPGADAPPPVATGTGNAIAFTGVDPGTYTVTVRARMSASNADDPRAWGQAITTVMYGAPERPFAQIIGPSRAEVGKPFTYELLLRTRYDITKTTLKLAGRWTLPDGTTSSTLNPASYTARDEDLAIGKFITLKYEAWVVGYEDSTTTTTTLSVPIWKYVWPTWSLSQSVVVPYAPTNSRITVVAGDPTVLGVLEGLTYSWTVPSTMRVLNVPTNKLDTTIDFGGTHPVSVTIADRRGNSTTLDTTVTVADAAPYVIALKVSNMSQWSHAPLTVGLTPKVSGGHPLDAITGWSYYLDGSRLDLPNKNIAQVPVLSPGSHTVEVRITSKMGATATQSAVVNVPSNVPATCGVEASTSTGKTAIYLKANCVDPDGAITKYQWYVNGSLQTIVSGYKWTYLVPAGSTWPVRIDLTVTDDGGGVTSSGVNVN